MRRVLPLFVLALLLSACADAPSTLPTEVRHVRSSLVASTCSAALLDSLRARATALFASDKGGQSAAVARIRNVGNQCGSDRHAAQAQVRALEQFVLRKLADGVLVDPDVGGLTVSGHVSALLQGLYRYSGFALAGAGVASPLVSSTITTVDSTAGIRIPAGALAQEVVIIITPLPDSTTLPNNPYPEYGPAVDITTSIGPVTFLVPVTVGICPDESVPASAHYNLRIAHGVTPTTTELLPLAAQPSFLECFNALASNAANDLRLDRHDVAGSAARALRWAGSRVAGLLTPRVAYALHGGLGGMTESLSPFKPVDVGSAPMLFASSRDSSMTVPPDLYTMNPDGSNVVRIVSNDSIYKSQSAWSPDRSKIAFVGRYIATSNDDIYVMNANGTGLQRLTNAPAADLAPAWSPDGTKIAFHSQRDGNYEVYVMNADGTGQTNLSNDAGYDFHPTWSPDGTTIVFGSTRAGGWQIFRMNANGSSVTQLTFDPAIKAYPAWSPTGSKIAYERYPGLPGACDVYLMNPDGTNQTALTTTGYNIAPSWNPLGNHLAYQVGSQATAEIWVMRFDGSGKTQLTSNGVRDETPSWR